MTGHEHSGSPPDENAPEKQPDTRDELPPTLKGPGNAPGSPTPSRPATPPSSKARPRFHRGGARPAIQPCDLTSERLLRDAPRVQWQDGMRPALGGIPLLAKLGQGGMGCVYYGVHPRLNIGVAVKVLPFHLAEQDPTLIDRFIQEAQIAAETRSPHLVQVLDVNEDAGLYFIVMEYVRGTTAGKLLAALRQQQQTGLSQRDAVEIAIAATTGLDAAHAMGIIHRDIKPDNIIIPQRSREGTLDTNNAKLMDLGLARVQSRGDGMTGLTATESAMGTPGYMAPEQALEAHSADNRSDIFSMGATLYALLCGRSPFHRDSPMKTIFATIHDATPPLNSTRGDLDAELCRIVERCLEKKPEKRFPTSQQLLRALRQVRDRLEDSASSPPLPISAPQAHYIPPSSSVPLPSPSQPTAIEGLADSTPAPPPAPEVAQTPPSPSVEARTEESASPPAASTPEASPDVQQSKPPPSEPPPSAAEDFPTLPFRGATPAPKPFSERIEHETPLPAPRRKPARLIGAAAAALVLLSLLIFSFWRDDEDPVSAPSTPAEPSASHTAEEESTVARIDQQMNSSAALEEIERELSQARQEFPGNAALAAHAQELERRKEAARRKQAAEQERQQTEARRVAAEEQKRKAVDTALQAADRALKEAKYEEAETQLATAERLGGDERAISQRREELKRRITSRRAEEEKEQKLVAELERFDNLVPNDESLDQAEQRLETARAIASGDARVRERVAKLQARRAEIARKREFERLITKAENAAGKEATLDAAKENLKSAREMQIDDPRLKAIETKIAAVEQRVLEREREQRRRVAFEQDIKRIEALVTAGKLESAESELETAAKAYPRDEDVIRLQKQIAAGKEEQRRRKTFDEAMKQAAVLLEAGSLEQAEARYGEAQKLYPQDPALAEARQKLRAAFEQKRRAEFDALTARAGKEIDANSFAAAKESILAAERLFPAEKTIPELKNRWLAAVDAAERRSKFAEVLQNAERALQQGSLSSADTGANEAERLLPGRPETARLKERIASARARQTQTPTSTSFTQPGPRPQPRPEPSRPPPRSSPGGSIGEMNIE
ncbi:MAG TPA: protein kinase [Planctomycetota bacterium]|nr:protein kinase [Planctomycetota bacterium]